MQARLVIAAFLCLAVLVSALPKYNIDPSQIAVSGLSSGAYFAVQFQLAFSKSIRGAGVVAGGPFYCAEGSMLKALTNCMSSPLMINVATLVSYTKSMSDIDSLDNLQKHKIFLFSGTSDTIVFQGVMKKLNDYYRAIGVSSSQIVEKFDVPSQHAFVTDSYGNSCSHLGSPWINNCQYDLAGALMSQIYGDLKPRGEMSEKNFMSFSQDEFGASTAVLAKTGFMYVPSGCQRNETCKLLFNFHGCEQYYANVGDVYVKNTGMNQWAESNNIIVVYPQTTTSMLSNPKGCFDWWGFTGSNYCTKSGKQLVVMRKIIEALTGRPFGQ